jgi:hypothetical protein
MGRTGSKVPSGYKQFQIQKYTPEMMELFQSLFANVSPDSYLGKLAAGDQSEFEAMEAPALRQFSELQGNMASRFSGMGTGGRKSSGFQNTMNQASSDFAQDLQSKRMQTRMDAIKELMGFSDQILKNNPYETGLVQKPQSGWQQFANSVGGGVGKAVGDYVASGFNGGGGGGGAASAAAAA